MSAMHLMYCHILYQTLGVSGEVDLRPNLTGSFLQMRKSGPERYSDLSTSVQLVGRTIRQNKKWKLLSADQVCLRNGEGNAELSVEGQGRNKKEGRAQCS